MRILLFTTFIVCLAANSAIPANLETRTYATTAVEARNATIIQQVSAAAFSLWKRNVHGDNEHHDDENSDTVVLVTVGVFVVLFLLIIACLCGFFIGLRKNGQDMAMQVAKLNSSRQTSAIITSARASNREFEALSTNTPPATIPSVTASIAAPIITSAPQHSQRPSSVERERRTRKQKTSILDDELSIYDVRAKDQ